MTGRITVGSEPVTAGSTATPTTAMGEDDDSY
jgi:hypothetical protein